MFKYNTTTRTVLADLYTPVSMYMRLRDIYPQSVLMESSDYHEKDNSHSFIGLNPIGRNSFTAVTKLMMNLSEPIQLFACLMFC